MLAAALPGCVRVYQPLSGLHRPVVVDPAAPNLRDVQVVVACTPGDYLNREQSGALCRRVAQLLEQQGATVQTAVGGGAPGALVDAPMGDAAARSGDLTVELRARQVHRSNHPASLAAFALTFSLAPWVREQTFAQEIVIRDAQGSLLAHETLEGRLVQSTSSALWAGHRVADLLWRSPEEEITGKAANAALSRDLYRQLSQIVYNAHLQAEVTSALPLGGEP